MKTTLIAIITLLIIGNLKAQNTFIYKSISPCNNLGFEYLDFTNWSGEYAAFPPTTSWSTGFVSNGLNANIYDYGARHTIVSGLSFDSIAINSLTGLPDIPVVAPGGLGASVRLGNARVGETERLKYQFLVTASDTLFNFKYALVFEDTIGHNKSQQPRFDIRVYDVSSVLISADSIYTDSTFLPFIDIPSFLNGYYKKWTSVSKNLTPYIGTTVTIEFQTSDCALNGHFGYAYIDAYCSSSTSALIKEDIAINKITISPNPSISLFNFSNLENGNTIEIFDITGSCVSKIITKETSFTVDLHQNDKGIYLYRVTNDKNQVQQGKIILQ